MIGLTGSGLLMLLPLLSVLAHGPAELGGSASLHHAHAHAYAPDGADHGIASPGAHDQGPGHLAAAAAVSGQHDLRGDAVENGPEQSAGGDASATATDHEHDFQVDPGTGQPTPLLPPATKDSSSQMSLPLPVREPVHGGGRPD